MKKFIGIIMARAFEVSSSEIKNLTSLQLTQLLKVLLRAEAFQHGIAQSGVEVALNITTGDGGEDGRISWKGKPTKTDYFPKRTVLFQNKATEMTSKQYGTEVVTKKTKTHPIQNIKPLVNQVLTAKGSYIVFTTQELNTQQKQDRISEIRTQFSKYNKSYALTCDLKIYDASQIADWVNLYLPAIVAVQDWAGRPYIQGLKTFSSWGEFEALSQLPFVSVESRDGIVETLRKDLLEPKTCSRIVGLSGLGKTRTAFEVFEGSALLQSLVVYVDAALVTNIGNVLADWISSGLILRVILVVDNCDYKLHNKLVSEVKRTSSQVSLLTLDYNFENVSGSTNIFRLEPMSPEELTLLLNPVYKSKIKDLDLQRIVKFAQGFPQMAVLLAEARLNDKMMVGQLTDDDLANKLLWSREVEKNLIHERIMRVCSLFNFFGISGDVESELAHIATILGDINIDIVFECISHFTERGLIDQRGKYGQVVPKPLAIRLAAQWWTNSREQLQKEFVANIPEAMVETFCEQIEQLDYIDNVKSLTLNLCGPKGPFGQAEVILSNRGSRLFRSFVNVDPDATSSALFKVITKLNQEELHRVDGDVRRNLVWALEKLCYHKHLFEDAAWCMLLLASAENESYSNNATGMFAQLFSLDLSGTAAEPDTRFSLLNRALELNQTNIDSIILKALERSIQLHGGTRTVGAEYQGTKAPIQEWAATIWQEVFDFWQSAFDLLLVIFRKNDSQKDRVVKIIGRSIRGFVSRGRIVMMDQAIREVVGINGQYWPEALESIQHALLYEGKSMKIEGLEALNSWLNLLSPDNETSLPEKIKIIVSSPPWQSSPSASGRYIDVAAEKAVLLADEVTLNVELLYPVLNNLLIGEQKQAYVFGKQLIHNIDNFDKIISLTLKEIENLESPNISFALGLFDGVFQKSLDKWNNIIHQISGHPKLRPYYPNFIRTGIITKEHLRKILEYISNGTILPRSIFVLSTGMALDKTPYQEVVDFCLELSTLNSDAAWAALNIIFMYLYSKNEIKEIIKEPLIKLILAVPLYKENNNSNRDTFEWVELTKSILKQKNDEFVISIANQLLAGIHIGFDYGDVSHSFKPLLAEIFQSYGSIIWPIFGHKIASTTDGLQLYRLQQLLDRENSFSITPSIVSYLPIDVIISWCKDNPKIGPNFIASCVNIFEIEDEKQKTSSLFIALLENFGNDEGVISSLNSNMYSRGWSGSLVPYLVADKDAFLPLLEHKNNKVTKWIKNQIAYIDKRIEVEQNLDEERTLRH